MSASDEEADGSSRVIKLRRAISLLEEALQVVDDLQDYPEVGARLAGLIESLEVSASAHK